MKVNKVGSNIKNGKIIECLICGKQKYRNLSDLKHAKGLNYCSRVCQVKGTNNGYKKGHPSFWTKESSIKMSKTRMGHVVLIKTRKLISKAHLGRKTPWNTKENHYRWLKDRSKLKKYLGSEEKRSPSYKFWRIEVLRRDHFICRINNKCKGRLEAHHIWGFTKYPKLKYDINNGITLCHAHHPRKRAEEKRLIPVFEELVSVSK